MKLFVQDETNHELFGRPHRFLKPVRFVEVLYARKKYL